MFPKRPKDSVAFGLSYSHVSDAYSSAYANSFLGAPVLGSEKAYEVNYLYQATPFFMVQPVVQWYQTLGANPQNPDRHRAGIPNQGCVLNLGRMGNAL